MILEGVFSDEEGDYEAGTYCRHPIDSSHSPWSTGGCTLWVKLRQMTRTTEDMKKIIVPPEGDQERKWIEKESGRNVLELFFNPETNERVRMERWGPNVEVNGSIPKGGEEILVWKGGFKDEEGEVDHRDYTKPNGMHWIRNPASAEGKPYRRVAGSEGCQVLIKEGHLGA